jgi:hypothetical protein
MVDPDYFVNLHFMGFEFKILEIWICFAFRASIFGFT